MKEVIFNEGTSVVRMWKFFNALNFLILLSAALPKHGFGDEDEYPVWVENYYNCVCHGGDPLPLAACRDRIDASNGEGTSNFSADQLTVWVSHVRRAKTFLELATSNSTHVEQRNCLQMALSTIQSSLGFMMKEIQVRHPELPVLVKALYKTSRFAYQWATKNCVAGREYQPIAIQLPDSRLCRSY